MSPERVRLPFPRAVAFVPAVLAVLLLGSGCGKKGPPLPPLKRGPDRVTAVSARQEGKSVVLSGLMPEHSQDGGPLAPIEEVRVFRLDRGGFAGVPGPGGRSLQRTAHKQFTKEARRVAVLSGEDLGRSISGKRFAFADSAPLAGPIPEGGKDLTYAVTVVDTEKRSSPLSAFAAIRILPPPLPPANLKKELMEKRIRLSWEPPPPQAQKETPLYNVYRSELEGVYPDPPRNQRPLSLPLFEETDFAYGRTYYYVIRSALVSGASSRESENSVSLQVLHRDIYAPAPPTGFAVSAERGAVKLYWFPNEEPDLAGYRIHRSESESEGFAEIARVGAGESSYVDQAVKPGVKYYYCLTAVDSSNPPNESGRSEVRGDRLPPADGPPGDVGKGIP